MSSLGSAPLLAERIGQLELHLETSRAQIADLQAEREIRAKLPAEIRGAGPAVFGLLLGVGAVLAELPGSLVKRQLDIPAGAQRRSALGILVSLWDQGDFVPGVWLALAPVWVMPVRQVAFSFVVVSALHLLISVVGYAIGARRTVL